MVNAACLPFGQPWSILGPALAAAAGAVHVAIGVAVASLASIFFNLGRAGAAEAAGGLGINSRDCRKQSHRCEQSNESAVSDFSVLMNVAPLRAQTRIRIRIGTSC